MREEIAEQRITNALRQSGYNDEQISAILSGIQIPLGEYIEKILGKDGTKPPLTETPYEIH